MGISARQIAFQALISVEIDRSYSNIVLNNLLTDFDVDIIDKNFVSGSFTAYLKRSCCLIITCRSFPTDLSIN